ncbi:class I SAM-dependent methyltransferase [Membranihabitans maritimus]|uniref:class I SAM-dependent methyltransferase n=1 Tax=Membranihabitans maritimus TaxID=2904244 RepID=UPI001F3DF138|nr:class I SAM-dependent methyltransferase [Membranihabitans maritimus]
MRILYGLLLFQFLILSCSSEGTNESRAPTNYVALEPDNLDDHISFYESAQRHIWQKPNYVIELFGEPLSIKTIADIGASTGYFTFHSLPKVHKMIAIDIDSTMIEFIKSKSNDLPVQLKEKLDIRLATENNSMLNKNEVDGVLMVSTYPYIVNGISYLKNLKDKLRTGGKIILIEFKDEDLPNGPPDSERVLHSDLTRDLKTAGYITQLDTTSLEYQYIVVATLPTKAN